MYVVLWYLSSVAMEYWTVLIDRKIDRPSKTFLVGHFLWTLKMPSIWVAGYSAISTWHMLLSFGFPWFCSVTRSVQLKTIFSFSYSKKENAGDVWVCKLAPLRSTLTSSISPRAPRAFKGQAFITRTEKQKKQTNKILGSHHFRVILLSFTLFPCESSKSF